MKFRRTLLLITAFLISQAVTAQSKNDSLYKFFNDSNYYAKMQDSLMKVYTKQNKEYEKMKNDPQSKQKGLGNSFFGLNLDLIFGVGITNTEFEVNSDSTGLSNTGAKSGPMIGLNVNLNLIGFAFSTGLNYSSKGYTTGNSNTFSANYINIPLMFAFNFGIGKKVEVDIAAGPYIGILTSNDTSQFYRMKNIDIGIAETLQGAYFFNRFLGAVIGVKYEHGGLNSLLEAGTANSNVTSIKPRNWFIYTGMKFVL